MPDQPEHYRVGKNNKETDFDTEPTPDYGVKGLIPPSFVAGQSHVGLQIFLSKHMVDNPVITTVHSESVVDNTKTATVATVHSESVVDNTKTATITTVHSESVA